MLREQREHVIEERDASADGSLTLPIDHQLESDAGFLRVTLELRLTLLHLAQLSRRSCENKAQIPEAMRNRPLDAARFSSLLICESADGR